MKTMHPMNKTSSLKTPSCGCQNCLCGRGARCRCHDYNTLLALRDFGRMARRRFPLSRARP